jgi:hypothetical protein
MQRASWQLNVVHVLRGTAYLWQYNTHHRAEGGCDQSVWCAAESREGMQDADVSRRPETNCFGWDAGSCSQAEGR